MHKYFTIAVVLISVSFADQHILFDGELTYNGKAESGQIDGPSNWKSPANYFNGKIYRRVEIISRPSTIEVRQQMCHWHRPFGTGESCSYAIVFPGSNGQVKYDMFQGPAGWWCNSSNSPKCPDWTNVDKLNYVLKGSDGKWFQNCGGSHCTKTNISSHVPIKVHYTDILVSAGAKLSPPERYKDGCGNGWDCAGDAVSLIGNRHEPSAIVPFSLVHSADGSVRISAQKTARLTITNAQGKEVKQVSVRAGEVLHISSSDIGPGLYFAAKHDALSKGSVRFVIR